MKLVLVDRDGVINEELQGYVKSPEELIIYPKALEAFALLHAQGFTCVVITNQSVVGRGIISQSTLDRIHGYLQDKVKAHGGKIEEFFVCIDHPDNASYRRKPKPGMLIEAIEKYGAEASKTSMIGDAHTDMEAARAAGCRRYLVMTGKGESTSQKLNSQLEPTFRCADILDAARQIVKMA